MFLFRSNAIVIALGIKIICYKFNIQLLYGNLFSKKRNLDTIHVMGIIKCAKILGGTLSGG